MVRTRVVVALIAILLVGGGALLVFLPGDEYLKNFFLQQLEQSIGRKIDVHRIKLVLFPRIRLELTQVAIHDRNSDDVLLSAQKLDAVLRLLPLLRKQVVGKRLFIEEPTLTLRRDRGGHWNLLDQVAHGGSADQDAVETISRIFHIREATLVNGKLIIIDDARPEKTRSMTLESVDVSLLIRAERGQADLKISASQAGDKGLSTISLAGTISAAQRQTLSSNDSSTSETTLQFEGMLAVANLNLRELAEFFGSHPIRAAAASHFGEAVLTSIPIHGEPIADVQVKDFRLPPQQHLEWQIPEWARRRLKDALTTRPVIHQHRCVHCGICRNDCPQQAITEGARKLRIDYRKCIRCFCCQEFCPPGAITVGQGWALMLIGSPS